jgi:hypothetical protein
VGIAQRRHRGGAPWIGTGAQGLRFLQAAASRTRRAECLHHSNASGAPGAGRQSHAHERLLVRVHGPTRPKAAPAAPSWAATSTGAEHTQLCEHADPEQTAGATTLTERISAGACSQQPVNGYDCSNQAPAQFQLLDKGTPDWAEPGFFSRLGSELDSPWLVRIFGRPRGHGAAWATPSASRPGAMGTIRANKKLLTLAVGLGRCAALG